ncbi:PDZ domain-containing protein [Tabrizicola piscis]|uniref:PDZ domain-containing protein n=1 Tax=Tabrizicola piscis TaxID=2494374 RepID=A0A3S8U870_9RHOB|nr:trypsin-like peptidase domain-containing protein [Tabrizicola piscis]AZL59758.1 PDZ domain-containing protein [Tabrizicola piscis]
MMAGQRADVGRDRKGRKRTQPRRYLVEVLAALVVIVLVALVGPATASPLDQAMDRVFTVHSADAEDRFLGSAFLWGDGSVAVTNAHVVGTADEVRLVDRHGTEETALVIARDAVRDVAVIAVAPGRTGLVLATDAVGLGDEVFALGAPLGVEFTLTVGRISATARQVEITVPLRMLQHDAAVNPGSSGGPLVDIDGRLVGMNSQIADGSRMFVGIAYAISAMDLDAIVTGLIEETLAPFPSLGLTARPVDRQVAAALGVDAAGLLVDGVTPGGLAEAAGLRGGDIILAVDGTKLEQPGDLAFAVERASASGATVLAVLRDGDRLDLPVPLTTNVEATGLRLRQMSPALPETVQSYRLSALGVVLADGGLVSAVTDNSPAVFAGLAQGDRILTVNGATVDLANYEVTKAVLLLVRSPGGLTRHIYLDPWGAHDGVRPVGGANVLDPDVVVF